MTGLGPLAVCFVFTWGLLVVQAADEAAAREPVPEKRLTQVSYMEGSPTYRALVRVYPEQHVVSTIYLTPEEAADLEARIRNGTVGA